MAIYVNAYLCRYVKICHICVNVRSSSVCQQTPWSNEHHLTGTQLSKPDFCWTRPGEVCILLFMTHTHSHAHALAHAHTYMHTHDTHTHALTHIFGCLFYDNTHTIRAGKHFALGYFTLVRVALNGRPRRTLIDARIDYLSAVTDDIRVLISSSVRFLGFVWPWPGVQHTVC